MRKNRLSVKDLCLMALYAAMFVILDYLGNTLPILQMPQGGSIGFGTIALLLASYHLGWQKGLIVAVVSLPLQFMTGKVWFEGIVGYTLDYVIAFSVYGMAAVFPNYKYFYSGIVVTNVVRFISSTISGMVVYHLNLGGSIAYNGPYMLATLLVGLIFVPLIHQALLPVLKKY